MFVWGQSTESDTEFVNTKASAQTITDGLRPRALFDVPKENGLCLPYLFIADNGKEKNEIGMTYRLKAHPDIIINLRSKTAMPTPTKDDMRNPEIVDDWYQMWVYWGQKIAKSKSYRSLWHLPALRPTRFAESWGHETFMAIVWKKDETEESYLYQAVRRGDPGNPEAVPDIHLVVEQTRQNAIKRGVKPLSKDEFLELAKKIKASVEVRPTQ